MEVGQGLVLTVAGHERVEGGASGLKARPALAPAYSIRLSVPQEALKGAGDCIAMRSAGPQTVASPPLLNAKVVFNLVRARLAYLALPKLPLRS